MPDVRSHRCHGEVFHRLAITRLEMQRRAEEGRIDQMTLQAVVRLQCAVGFYPKALDRVMRAVASVIIERMNDLPPVLVPANLAE